MATAIIQSEVSSTTIIGSRDDVNIGNVVSLEHNGSATTYFWEFLSKPPASTASFSSASSATPTFTPDVVGSYLIRLTIDGDTAGSDVRVIAVKTQSLGIRIPAAGETNEYDNNPVTGVDGWHEALYNGFLILDTQIIRADGNGVAPTASIDWGTQRIVNLGAGVSGSDAARFDQIPASLSALNAKIGVTLDTTSDTRTPTTHSLGSSFHTAITLAELNSLVSDATLDDSGDSRPIAAHDLGGANHTSTTLAALNALITDATLDDASSLRPPTSHDIAGSSHAAATLANFNLKILDAELVDEADISLDFAYSRGANIFVDLGPISLSGSNGSIFLHDGYIRFEEGGDPDTLDNYGALYTKETSGVTELFYKDSAGNVRQLTPTSGGGNTLDQAYDEGGSGAGRIITASAGPVEISAGSAGGLLVTNSAAFDDSYQVKIITTPEGDDAAALGIIVQPGDGGRTNLYGIVVDNYGTLTTGNNNIVGIRSRVESDGSDASTVERISFQAVAAGPSSSSRVGLDIGTRFETAIRAAAGDVELDGGPLRFGEQASDPSSVADKGFLYVKDVFGITELFYMDSAGTTTQITDDGYLDTSNTLRSVGLWEQSGDPTPVVSKIHIYSKDVSGNAELFFQDGSGNVIQVTQNGTVVGTATNLDEYASKALLDAYATPDVVDGYALESALDIYAEKFLLDSYLTAADLSDGYIGFSYDELDPDTTDGSENSLELTFTPADPNALQMYRNGVLMRRVDSLADDYQEYTLSGTTVNFLASDEVGEWYSAYYVDGYNVVGAADGYSGTVEVSASISFVIENGIITNVIEV